MQQSESPKHSRPSDSEQADRPDGSKQWMRFAGLGMELAGYTLGTAGLGFLFDKYRGNVTPYATALGALIGFTFGMYRFIRQASQGSGD